MRALLEVIEGSKAGEFKKAVVAFCCAVGMAALFDFFFFYSVGSNLATAVFITVLFVLAVPLSPSYYMGGQRVFIVCATALFLASVYWDASIVGVSGALTGLIAMRLSMLHGGDDDCSALGWIPRITAFCVTAIGDFPLYLAVGEKKMPTKSEKLISYAIVIALTAFFSGVFLYLFSIASPQIAKFASSIFSAIANFDLSLRRFVVWGFIFAVCFAFFMVYAYGKLSGQFARLEKREWVARENKKPDEFPSVVARFVSIPLVVFNAVFAIQNFFDISYLFGGMVLPEGATYSEYANNGAFALALATVMAALIIIVCFSPKTADKNWRFARITAYIWIVQNILLCTTAVARLVSYTIAYDLTVARLAGFSFFLLVVIGFGLSFAMIAQGRRILWLINANIYTTVCMFVFWSLWDASKFAADFNVDSYIAGRSHKIDTAYLTQLGVPALPASLKLLNAVKNGVVSGVEAEMVSDDIGFLKGIEVAQGRLNERMSEWRRWYLQGAFIEREIAALRDNTAR